MRKFITTFNGKDTIAQVVTKEKHGTIFNGAAKIFLIADLGVIAALLTVGHLVPTVAVGIVEGITTYIGVAHCQAMDTQTLIQTDEGPKDIKSLTGKSGYGRRFRHFLNPFKF